MRLTDERLAHSLEHPEMRDIGPAIEATLCHPQFVRRSLTDSSVHLYYEYYAQTQVGGKCLCIAVKYVQHDAFVVTAYVTDKPKVGENIWPAK